VNETKAAQDWEISVLYDGDCPLCMREIRMLERRNEAGRLRTVDIAAPGFDPGVHGLTQEDVMARIHGVLPDGRVLEGTEVFRRAYAAVGLGWLLAPSRWPLIGGLFDRAYTWFARNRLRLTGRAESCDEHCTPQRRDGSEA